MRIIWTWWQITFHWIDHFRGHWWPLYLPCTTLLARFVSWTPTLSKAFQTFPIFKSSRRQESADLIVEIFLIRSADLLVRESLKITVSMPQPWEQLYVEAWSNPSLKLLLLLDIQFYNFFSFFHRLHIDLPNSFPSWHGPHPIPGEQFQDHNLDMEPIFVPRKNLWPSWTDILFGVDPLRFFQFHKRPYKWNHYISTIQHHQGAPDRDIIPMMQLLLFQ